MNSQPNTQPQPETSTQSVRPRNRLATLYWTLFLIGALVFFIFGSIAVADGQWQFYLLLLAASLAWTFILLIGVRIMYRGADPGKALGRVAVLFLLLNITNALATLSFI